MPRRSPKLDTQPICPAGYVTCQQLAAQYNRSEHGIRLLLSAANVSAAKLPRRNAAGVALGGRPLSAYPAGAAHAAISRPKRRARTCSPGYIALLAAAFHISRDEVKAILRAAGVDPTPRVCPTCGKTTLYYTDRTAAHTALSAAMRRYPLTPQNT